MDYYTKRHALVTGASTGLGETFAEELARRGCSRLTLVARSKDKLEALAQRLSATHNLSVQVVTQDLTDAEAAAAVVCDAERRVPVDILINNAGFGSCGRFEEQSLETQLAELQLNTATVLAMTHAALPGMLARGHGGILNVASTAAFQPLAYLATYAATKSFVLSLTEALWAENRERGVHLTALCPGPTKTKFFERMGHDLPGEYGPPLPVVRDGLDALAQGRSSKVSGVSNYLSAQAPRLAPRQLVARIGARMMAGNERAASQDHAASVASLDARASRPARR